MKKLIYIALIAIAFKTNAQVLSYDFYSYRINNMFNVNPAYAGKGKDLNLILSAQSQNKGVSYANKNFMFGLYSKISKKQALGGRLISDTRGAFQLLKADLSYAYITKIADESSLTMGLSAGILNNNLMVNRIENYQALDQTDPTLTKSYYNATQFTAGAGLLYNYKNLDVSVSLPHIITTSQPLNGYVNVAVFYTIKANDKFKLIPWVCYQNIPVTKSVTSIYLKSTFKDMVWLQAGYETNNTFNATFGINVENLSVGYGFRFSNQQFNAVTAGSHELTIGFKIPHRSKAAGTTTTLDNTSLNDIIMRLDKLSKETVTADNKASIKSELEKIKQQLQKAEIDNSTPEKAKEVSLQLQTIDETLKLIEQKLSNEK